MNYAEIQRICEVDDRGSPTYLFFFCYCILIVQNNVVPCDVFMQITLVNALTVPFLSYWVPSPVKMHLASSLEYSKCIILQELSRPFARHLKLSLFPSNWNSTVWFVFQILKFTMERWEILLPTKGLCVFYSSPPEFCAWDVAPWWGFT